MKQTQFRFHEVQFWLQQFNLTPILHSSKRIHNDLCSYLFRRGAENFNISFRWLHQGQFEDDTVKTEHWTQTPLKKKEKNRKFKREKPKKTKKKKLWICPGHSEIYRKPTMHSWIDGILSEPSGNKNVQTTQVFVRVTTNKIQKLQL